MTDILELARQLSAQGEPFVLATVVWRRAPSSGRTGAKAIIRPDGGVTGWLGGACAGPAVIREARRALEDGAPRLMFLDPPGGTETREGVVALEMGCVSEGALGIYLEPVRPPPKLVAVGRAPVVDALVGVAQALGWQAVAVEGAAGLPAEMAGASFVVVATMGHDDEPALEAALARPAPYVGLVVSRRRAKAVFDTLRSRGVPDEALARVHAPAGLDLGHLANPEIAVAIVAEIVQLHNAGVLRASGDLPGTGGAPGRPEVLDPVCGMTVEAAQAQHRATYGGVEYLFCCAGCQARFEADPAAYI